ncbi:polysaccharide pyruvyl transferase family protein [Sphingobacterium phlebotomi]|uniref:polysaccharide pyruvyl transferase family protein n=1 Tax=Sphingobacterium phlebotomi TaxID=2605433 RepID=UPI0016535A06|nr:polysaccharide pyruvyl transferase family protein [Sphingobacterium phlebotomi]
MKKVNLIYWDKDNFGDALNPFLIAELSGMPVQHKDIELSLKDRLSLLVKSILTFRFSYCKRIIFPWQTTIVAIGSTIHWAHKKSIIWGAGFMNQGNRYRGGEVVAVRGKLTDAKLESQGIKTCGVYGDAALLLPLWLPGKSQEKKYELGIVPHWSEVDSFKRAYDDRYFIIDLRTRNIPKIVEEINQCKYILSTSLHGIIVAHAYGIPALWIKGGYIETDGFKFHDYFSSVDIPLYDGFEHIAEVLQSYDKWLTLFEENTDKSSINNELFEIQKGLLRVAPFPLNPKYILE